MARRREMPSTPHAAALFQERRVEVPSEDLTLQGVFAVPPGVTGAVLFIHGNGSHSRYRLRDNLLARTLFQGRIATLLLSLLRENEGGDGRPLSDIGLLAERVQNATAWLRKQPETGGLSLGYYATGSGAAAAMLAAQKDRHIAAVVTRGGRLDLAINCLREIDAPTLLIVGQDNEEAIEVTQLAYSLLPCEKQVVIVRGEDGVSQEEPGVPEEVAHLAVNWFERFLPRAMEQAA